MRDLKVLLVEDEKKLAMLLKKAIGDNFQDFIVSHDGKDGFNKFLEYNPDIIISDIMLPKLNGLELVKKIKALNQDIPIIMISAYSDRDKLLQAIEIGVKKYFIKPFDPDDLIEFIQSLNISHESIIEFIDDFMFDIKTNSLYKENEYIKLTQREKLFLLLLLSKKDHIMYLYEFKQIWNDNKITNETIRTFVKRFRQKTSKNLIQNIKSQGYRLVIKQ